MDPLYEMARGYALVAHGDQKYGTEPYGNHLKEVDDVLVEFGHTSPTLRASGQLHDVVEDTKYTLRDLREIFPEEVVYIVDGVTSQAGHNRKTRNAATYPRILADVQRIIVKLADRIANVRHGIKEQNHGLSAMYKKEYPEFRKALYTEAPDVSAMWFELDRLLGWKS